MSQEKSSETTRRAFLGTATVATAGSLTAPVAGDARAADTGHAVGMTKLAEVNTDISAQLMSRAKAGDWTKPAAMAIPKEGYFKLEQGRYGPLFPKTGELGIGGERREGAGHQGDGAVGIDFPVGDNKRTSTRIEEGACQARQRLSPGLLRRCCVAGRQHHPVGAEFQLRHFAGGEQAIVQFGRMLRHR